MYRVNFKSETTNSWQTFCQILTDFQFFTERSFGKFAEKWLLKISPNLAALPCETLMSEKKRLTTKYKVV